MPRPGTWIFTLWLGLLALTMPPFAGANPIPIIDGPPSGFESLAAPRRTVVTVYYGGELIGNFSASYTPDSLTFTDPAALLTAIPAIEQTGPVITALADALPSHADLLCGRRPQEGCGKLDPPIVGVIFDEAQLTAELFVNRDLLSTQEQHAIRYLPLPERNFSSIARLNGAVSGADSTRPNYTLGNRSIYSLGEGSLTTATTLTNRGVRFDTFSADIEREGVSGSAGLTRSLPMQLAGDRDIAGLSVATSLRTRIDTRKTEGNAVILYLPRQSFVSIYREGRLYSSRNYEAGNQRIDTSELPDGAYTITLRIQEIGGAMREETRFFAKSEQIPPPDAPSYYLQGGVLRQPPSEDETVPQLTSAPLLRAGTVQRVAENVGFGVGLLGLEDRAALEPSLFLLTDDTQLRATALGSSARDYGLQAGVLYVRPDWNANLDARTLHAGETLPTEYAGLLSGITQGAGSVTYTVVPDVDLTLRASYIETDNMPAITSLGPAVTWRLWQEGESILYATADAARTQGREQGTAMLQFSYRLGVYGVTGESGYSHGSNAPGGFGSLRGWYDKSSAEQALIAGVNLHHDSRADSVGGDADWRTDMGHVRAEMQHSGGAQPSTTYGGNFVIGAAQTEDAVTLGGSEADMSAVLIEAEGDTPATLNIEVNGTPRGTVEAGHRQAIYLAPYNSYRIRLMPQKDSGMIHVEGGEQKVTLYPGNVVHAHWKITPFSVVAARIVEPDGTPLAGATLEGSDNQIGTNAHGYIQAELTLPESLIFTRHDGTSCRVALPSGVAPIHGVLLYKEPLVCKH